MLDTSDCKYSKCRSSRGKALLPNFMFLILWCRENKNNKFAVKCKNRIVSLQISPLFTTIVDEFLMSALLCLSLSTWDFSLNPRNKEEKKKKDYKVKLLFHPSRSPLGILARDNLLFSLCLVCCFNKWIGH